MGSNNWCKKSNENIESAKLLINNGYLSSSIHCSYYSCVQKILEVFSEFLQKTNKEIYNKSFNNNSSTKGYHNWLKKTILIEIRNIAPDKVRAFNNEFGKLKKLRIEADYHETVINSEKAKNGIYLSNKIVTILNNTFRL